MKNISPYDGIVGNSLTKDAIYQPYLLSRKHVTAQEQEKE
jgi:hypothetical protein